MKKLLLLFVLSVTLLSCTSEPLPSNISLNNQGKYLIHWESNQIEPSMSITIYHGNDNPKVVSGITDHNVTVKLYPEDNITIGINYKEPVDGPELYLAIYKYKSMDFTSGYYNPNEMDLIFEKESNTNGYGFSSCVKAIGQ